MTYLLSLLLVTTPSPEVWNLCDLIDVELQLGVELELITPTERTDIYERCLAKHG